MSYFKVNSALKFIIANIYSIAAGVNRIVSDFVRCSVCVWALLLAVALICIPSDDLINGIRNASDLILLLKNTLWISILISGGYIIFREINNAAFL